MVNYNMFSCKRSDDLGRKQVFLQLWLLTRASPTGILSCMVILRTSLVLNRKELSWQNHLILYCDICINFRWNWNCYPLRKKIVSFLEVGSWYVKLEHIERDSLAILSFFQILLLYFKIFFLCLSGRCPLHIR